MLGAIAGDIVGSVYEWRNIKTTQFPLFVKRSRFTDDTVLTVAVADRILHGGSYVDKFKEYYTRYPNAGYGGMFQRWAASLDTGPYNSWGNGSAMRVSAVGFAFDSLEEVNREATASAEVTHNHPEGIKGARATASAIYLARSNEGKADIKEYIEGEFGYNLDQPLDAIRKHYRFDVSCQGSVPQAIRAFLESDDFEDAIRKAISIGGDSDTIGCITGGIAQGFYGGVPAHITEPVMERLDQRLSETVREFMERFCGGL